MASCPKCDGFSQRFNIGVLREYRDIVRQPIELVSHGTFFPVHASCPLQDMFNTPLCQEIPLSQFSMHAMLEKIWHQAVRARFVLAEKCSTWMIGKESNGANRNSIRVSAVSQTIMKL
jgi:hypothetical protein